jgi:hydroxyethylthiazole kinase-like sugar kinase family protein
MTNEIDAAHDDVVRSRAQMADTVAQIEARVTGQMDAVKAKLDVVQMIRDNPWTALAIATGIGAAVSATGADTKAASAAAANARLAASATADKARQAAAATIEAAKGAPAQAHGALTGASRGMSRYIDTLAGSMVLGLISRLRDGEKKDAADR